MSSEQTVEQLNAEFGIDGVVVFDAGEGDLPRMTIAAANASAEIYLHGAHVTHFQPNGQHPVIFMSGSSRFENGKAIRGGVPVCFPWFCDKQDDEDAPAHGFARISHWTVESVSQGDEGEVTAVFVLGPNEYSHRYCPGMQFTARQTVTIGKDLVMRFSAVNEGVDPLTYEIALHSYFRVSDARQIAVAGLENCGYVDTVEKPGNPSEHQQGPEPISINEETDRFYADTKATCTIIDPSWQRRIIVEKENSDTTIVWNPWVKKAAAMADFSDDEWQTMVCVESANAEHNAVTIGPGQSHETVARISIEQS